MVDSTSPTTPSLCLQRPVGQHLLQDLDQHPLLPPRGGRRVHAHRELHRPRERHRELHLQLADRKRIQRRTDGRQNRLHVRSRGDPAGERPDPVRHKQRRRQLRERDLQPDRRHGRPDRRRADRQRRRRHRGGRHQLQHLRKLHDRHAHGLQRRQRLGLHLLDADTRERHAQRGQLLELRRPGHDHRQPEPERARGRLLPVHAHGRRPRRQHLRADRDRRGRQNRAERHRERSRIRERPRARHLRGDRCRLGREHGRRPAQARHQQPTRLSSNTCSTFGAFSNIGSLGPASPFTDSSVTTGTLLRVRVHGRPTGPATRPPRRRHRQGQHDQTYAHLDRRHHPRHHRRHCRRSATSITLTFSEHTRSREHPRAASRSPTARR